MVIKFKVCPRCRGDLYLAEDIFGKYLSCFQCGYLKDIDEPEQESEWVVVEAPEGERDAA